ncbi:S1C family serine protease [Actinoplanes aureus]|uniref:Trypsin-like peptidase domain-containing protein n=1 Tax=Actinoplanes aureus TaxID=2792083 RepID=A0A931G0X8_9ACTN|nr:trypsin-like peptidase domain-containing protein [Actinoplanes aureus]MBG0561824.1 trypsin-like peptidase domain-containing protein [Actinoplanes aureus]
MNENETNPRPADAAADNSSAERVESEQPTAAQPSVAPQSAAPQSAAPYSPAADSPATDSPSGYAPGAAQPPYSPAPQPPHSPWAQSPWQQPTSGHPGAGQDYPTTAVPYGHPHQGYQPPAGYGQPGYQQEPHSAYAAWQASQTPTGAEGMPPWARPVGVDQRTPGRGRKVLLTGAAAVLIALGGGAVGAATTLALDSGGNTPAVQTGNSSVTRVVDRSSLAQIAAAVQDSVVSITTGSGEGSGVVITADGYIVTNNHVVANAQGDSVNIIFADGTKATASVVGTDPRTDLAVVKASGVSDLKAAKFGDSSQIQVGDTVLALGSPLGLEGSVTAGIISAKDRAIQAGGEEQQPNPFGGQQQQSSTTMTGLLQTDAPINPGNSGGALVNTNGEVIGINSAIATSGAGSGNIGLGFAIPSNKAVQVTNALMQGKKVSHPALGVSVADAENGGALIRDVTSDSAAAKAKLQQGDVVTKVDGKAVGDSDDLVAAVQAGTVGQKMTLTFTRNGSEQTVTVTLQESQ